MKYYVDYVNGQIKIDVEKVFYQSENLENKITVLLTNVDDPYFLSVEFLRSDNRKCTIQTADSFGEEEDTQLIEDDVTYDIHNFTLTDQVLKCAGTLMFTVYINFVNSDTGSVIRRGVLFNGVNTVKKTVSYSSNSLLVLDDEDEAETTVTDILDELTAINAALATKQKKLVLQSNSGLTMTDSYKLSVKGSESGGIGVTSAGVRNNYSYDDFQIAKTPNYDKKIMKLNYFYNTAPVNKLSVYIYDGGTPSGSQALFTNNLTVTSTSISQIGTWQVEGTKYTYTFSGQTAKCIAKNYNHEYEFLTGYANDTNMTNSYSLSLDTTDSVCKQLLQDFINFAGRTYSHFMSSVTIPYGSVVIFKPIGKVGNVIYFSCENFMCTKTENSISKIVLVNIILGLVKDGNNYKVEFEVENSTGQVFTASNSKIYMPTELLKGVRVKALYNSEEELLYKFLEEENDSFNHEIIRIDTEPVNGSTHLIESGGVKAAIDDVEDDVSALQTQVNNLSSVQNVVDIVATKSALDALTTTNFEEDDKVQVIADETHDGASTVYNWTGSAWQYVGAYGGNSYTKTQTNSLLDGKQNVIDSNHKLSSDLIDDTNEFSDHKFVSADEKLEVSRLSSILIEKNYNQTASDYLSNLTEVSITGYISQADWNSLTERTSVTVALNFTDYTLAFNLRPQLSTVQNLIVEGFNFRGTANSPVSDGGMFEIEGSITSDREYTFTFRGFKVYTEAEVNALLSSKQDTLSGSTSIDVTSNVVSVKNSYVEGFFATSQEIDNMLEEVFG